MTKTPHSVHKIRFSDCDPFGHLNNARYLDYFLDAREEHLKHAYDFNLTAHYTNGLAWVIGSHEIVYIRPAVYNEQVRITSTLLQAENDSLHVEMLMMNEQQDQLKAVIRTTFIPINTKTGKRDQHPADLLEWAKTIENAEPGMQTNLQDRIKTLLGELKAGKSPIAG